MDNPYQAPKSEVASREAPSPSLDDVASGQKLVIYAILLYFLAAGLRAAAGPLGVLAMFACGVMSWVGIYRIARGLTYPMWGRVLLILSMLIPLIGLLVLVALSSRATARLGKAGYSVGLMGVRDYKAAG